VAAVAELESLYAMNSHTDRDDLGLFLSFIKIISVDCANHSVAFRIAKPFDHQEKRLRYIETELVLRNVREMHFLQNVRESDTPEFYRSAVLDSHPTLTLHDGDKAYYFGVDWGSEYYEWHFVAQSHDLQSLSEPMPIEQLSWLS
jgi:hypothetical protein